MMKEIYGMIMTNTSIPPLYFLDQMSWLEVDAVLKQINDKFKNSWEQTRILAWRFVSCFSEKRITPAEMMPYSWDEAADRKKIERPVVDPAYVKHLEKLVTEKLK